MRYAITIGIKPDGAAEVIAPPAGNLDQQIDAVKGLVAAESGMGFRKVMILTTDAPYKIVTFKPDELEPENKAPRKAKK